MPGLRGFLSRAGSAIATRWEHRAAGALDLRIAEAADVPWATHRRLLLELDVDVDE